MVWTLARTSGGGLVLIHVLATMLTGETTWDISPIVIDALSFISLVHVDLDSTFS